jgi:putative addiction module killer protein
MNQHVFEFTESDVFKAWIASIKDWKSKAFLERRLNRARAGNLGKVESVGGGVYEMKCDFGPGYRLYFFQLALGVYHVLCGGDKSTQTEDVRFAKILKSVKEQEYEREKRSK